MKTTTIFKNQIIQLFVLPHQSSQTLIAKDHLQLIAFSRPSQEARLQASSEEGGRDSLLNRGYNKSFIYGYRSTMLLLDVQHALDACSTKDKLIFILIQKGTHNTLWNFQTGYSKPKWTKPCQLSPIRPSSISNTLQHLFLQYSNPPISHDWVLHSISSDWITTRCASCITLLDT